MPATLIVAGINTGVGKTVASALLSKCLEAIYWKPLQTGPLQDCDTAEIRRLAGPNTCVLNPAYRFSAPLSPHAAARLEGATIDAAAISMPNVQKNLIIEMAGGVLSPLNDEKTQLEHYQNFKAKWVIVCRHYLGSINHALLTAFALKQAGVEIAGWIFNGEKNLESETFLLQKSNIPLLVNIPHFEKLSEATLNPVVNKWQQSLQTALLP